MGQGFGKVFSFFENNSRSELRIWFKKVKQEHFFSFFQNCLYYISIFFLLLIAYVSIYWRLRTRCRIGILVYTKQKCVVVEGEREFGTLCYEIFQCLEDQVQDQCQILTTAEPEEISEEQLAQACDDVNTVMQSQPGLANQDNEPLKLIIMKGTPERWSEWQQLYFIYDIFEISCNK